jgi:hypothetical protein
VSRASTPKKKNPEKDFLSPEKRAEDILLGALGFGEEATIVSIVETAEGFRGTGAWADGEAFDFESEDPPSELESWALQILKGIKS